MNAAQAGKLLGLIAMYDYRRTGDADVVAWLKVIGDIDYADAKEAVERHYADSTDRIMPGHIRQRVKAVRRQRLERAPIAAPPPEPGRYLGALRAGIRAIAGSFDIRRAIGGPVRAGEPPQAWREARAALPTGTVARRGSGSLQELARQQAAESQAARAAAEAGTQ